jgi:hypothetical protein|tara:strand:- start:5061 stop:5501 length:441 start_codon:yes stop_codon:yes gene_type:complete
MSRENLRTYIRNIIRELLDEKNLEETSFSSGAGAYNTPFAFTGKGKSGKKKKKEVATNSTGYNVVKEGKYHDYRNDDTLSPKQKIGRSMREIRDHLTEIDKLTKMNVRLKNEMDVDSRSYWKNTHKAMRRVSERLVKLANRVGQLY